MAEKMKAKKAFFQMVLAAIIVFEIEGKSLGMYYRMISKSEIQYGTYKKRKNISSTLDFQINGNIFERRLTPGAHLDLINFSEILKLFIQNEAI